MTRVWYLDPNYGTDTTTGFNSFFWYFILSVVTKMSFQLLKNKLPNKSGIASQEEAVWRPRSSLPAPFPRYQQHVTVKHLHYVMTMHPANSGV